MRTATVAATARGLATSGAVAAPDPIGLDGPVRFVVDRTWRRVGERAVLAGSPLRMFHLTPAGATVAAAIERGDEVGSSTLLDRLVDAGAVHPAPVRPDEPVGHFRADVTVVTPQLGGRAAADGRIVVDDGSDPPIVGATLRLEENVGPGGARNAARSSIRTPIVCFVDADVELPELDPAHPGHDHWWRTVLRHFDDPSVGAVAPRVVGDARSSLDLGGEPARVRAGTRVGHVPAAVLLVRVAAFDAVGGFDRTLRVGEDVDLVWRLDQAGWTVRYEPAVLAHHRPRVGLRARLRQQVQYGSSSAPLALRHPGALVPYRSDLRTAATAAFVFLGGRLGAAGAVATAGWSVRQVVARSSAITPTEAARLVAHAHTAAGRQALTAVRRAWWPLLVPFLWSRRVRRTVLLAIALAPRQAAFDVAFSIGVWRSVVRTGDSGALRPDIGLVRS